MPLTTLLFDEAYDYLGEVITEKGALVEFLLSDTGEQWLGHAVREWQTQGVEGRVQPRDPGFLEAFRLWSQTHRIELLNLSAATVPCWEKMLRLPFSPVERFTLMQGVSRLPPEQVGAWTSACDEAQRAVEHVL